MMKTLDRHPPRVEVAGDDKTIAAIIPSSAQNRHPARLEVRILLPEDTSHLRSGIFHQDDTRDAIGLNGQAIELTHFGCCRHPHSIFPLRAAA